MNIYDTFIYNNEDLILDIRLNCLNKFVEKFIIVEAKYTHQGKEKKNFLNLSNFNKFKNKITYLFIENFPPNLSNWGRENFQRNYISKSFQKIQDNDFVMISDIDEIPNLRKFKYNEKLKYTVFCQKNFSYKFNLINKTFPIWHGTKGCKKKHLKNPQWLRNQKIKKKTFLNFFNIKWNVINNGGWHFSYLMNPDQIREKIMSFGHAEFNQKKFIDITNIEEKVSKNLDLFEREQIYEKVDFDNSFPLVIHQDKKNLSKWII